MSHTYPSFLCLSLVLSSVFTFGALPASAKDKEPIAYPQSGKVLATSSKGMHFYQIATDSRVYLLLCSKTTGFHFGFSECKLNGKPIAAGDAVQFRVDGDWAYIPAVNGAEEKLHIFTEELKVIPPLAASSPDESRKTANAGGQHGMVIGTGIHIQGQKQGSWSTNPSSVSSTSFGATGFAPPVGAATPSAPVMATGPVTAIPVTGGAPVLVMPTGPVGGGVVTGIPVTGGAPVIGIPTGPVMGAPVGAPRAGGGGGGGGPHWVHLLRLQTGDKIYQLECSGKPCEVDNKQIALGDTLAIRVDKKWAYVKPNSDPGAKEQKLRILSETDGQPTSDSK